MPNTVDEKSSGPREVVSPCTRNGGGGEDGDGDVMAVMKAFFEEALWYIYLNAVRFPLFRVHFHYRYQNPVPDANNATSEVGKPL